MTRSTHWFLPLGLATLLLGGCVTSGTFQKKVDELEQLRKETTARDQQQKAQIADLEKKVKELQSSVADLESSLAGKKVDNEKLGKQLDEQTALAGELKSRLEKLGQNIDKLASEKGQLATSLADAAARLEELRKQKAAAEARAATYHDLMKKLKSMIDAGQLKVVIRDGRMLIALPNDVLFDSGKTALKAEGQDALAKVAQVLATFGDRKFLVAGHTDNQPIRSAKFPSNWELSTERALVVTHLLIKSGMQPQTLAPAGYGEFSPVSANDTPEHMAQNRRIEIVLQPNISDLPSIEDTK